MIVPHGIGVRVVVGVVVGKGDGLGVGVTDGGTGEGVIVVVDVELGAVNVSVAESGVVDGNIGGSSVGVLWLVDEQPVSIKPTIIHKNMILVFNSPPCY